MAVEAAAPTRPSTWVDRLGILASTLCLIHCIGLPLLALALPALAGDEEPWLHRLLFALVAVLAAWAFAGRRTPLRLRLLAGLGLLGLAAPLALPPLIPVLEGELFDHASTVLGSVLLVLAHWYNRRRSCSCPSRAAP